MHVTSKKNHFICHAYAHIIQQVYRKNWMFRLVGSEVFHIGKNKKVAEITISSKGMSFEYGLTVDGKPLEKFVQVHAKNTRTWLPSINGTDHRIVLGKNISLDIILLCFHTSILMISTTLLSPKSHNISLSSEILSLCGGKRWYANLQS